MQETLEAWNLCTHIRTLHINRHMLQLKKVHLHGSVRFAATRLSESPRSELGGMKLYPELIVVVSFFFFFF